MNSSDDLAGDGANATASDQTDAPVTSRTVLARVRALYAEIFNHDGYGDIRIEMRILRRGQKEVIVHCGKQYRFVLDYPDLALTSADRKTTNCDGGAA